MVERKSGEQLPASDQLLAVYKDTITVLYRYVASRTSRQRWLAEDITQETYTRALSSWTTNGLPREPIAWLKTVASNILRDHYRRVRPSSIESTELEHWLQDASAQRTETMELVMWGVAQLSEDQATLLDLYYWDHHSIKQISQLLGRTEKSVERRLARARTKLKQKLRPHLAHKNAPAENPQPAPTGETQ